jgi:hypothetical protein
MNTLAASEHIAELRRAADHWRAEGRSLAVAPALTQSLAVGLRLAGADDAHLLARLAALDDAPALQGRVLLALIDGEAVAALSLLDGRVLANPFIATSEAVALLRLRSEHLSGRRAHRRLRSILRPRFA